jgi:hypothetical protein
MKSITKFFLLSCLLSFTATVRCMGENNQDNGSSSGPSITALRQRTPASQAGSQQGTQAQSQNKDEGCLQCVKRSCNQFKKDCAPSAKCCFGTCLAATSFYYYVWVWSSQGQATIDKIEKNL